MAIIRPFKGLKPPRELVAKVATKPFDFYTRQQRLQTLRENPHSFLHVIMPESGKLIKSKPNSPELYKKSKLKFEEFVKQGKLTEEEQPSLYIYTQVINGTSHTGVIGCASVDDYQNEVIRKHEHTIKEREQVLKNYLKICDINAEPVCMTYPGRENVNQLINRVKTSDPVFEFTSDDGIEHFVWQVKDEKTLNELQNAFEEIPHIYIADGHHRTASSVLLAEEMRQHHPDYDGTEPFNYFMCIFFPDDQLKIYEFNRLVKDLNGMKPDEFLDQLKADFDVEEREQEIVQPQEHHRIGLYLDRKWYLLKLKTGKIDENDPVKSLDVSILSDFILDPILNIKDLRTDTRIDFISGKKAPEALMQKVNSGKYKAAFTLFPVQGEQFYKIADGGHVMPPKSTWIEPKLRSGLVVYSLSRG